MIGIRSACAAVASAFVLTGCADRGAGGREEVAGTVSLRGRPMDRGYIMFVPVSPDTPTRASARVVNGEYKMARTQGLVPGRYKVSISSPDGKTPVTASDAAPGPTGNFASRDRVPVAFNTRSTLEVEVRPGERNTFDFPIP
jgi:hypothetical protein